MEKKVQQRSRIVRNKRLRLKKEIRYKVITVIGGILLVLLVVYMANILLVENGKAHHFGLSEDSYDYQTTSDLIFDLFHADIQNAPTRSLRQQTMNESASELNATDEDAEDQRIRHDQFPTDLFTLQQKRMGAILLHILGIIYMFTALALVCDEFFVPSLEIIIEKLHIPEDVAGATFMAAGGSAPEFFTSLVGVFFAKNAVGFGTIVGSAVFNILFVIGVVGLLAKHTLQLTWWPLFRDTFFYTVALATLIGFFQNGLIEWYESLVLFILYILYVLFMFINSPAEKYMNKLKNKLFCCSCPCSRSSRVHSAPDSVNGTGRSTTSTNSCNRSLIGSTVLIVQPVDPTADSSRVASAMCLSSSGIRPSSQHVNRTISSANHNGERHQLRVSSAKHVKSNDIETDTKTNGRLYPTIKEALSSPDTPDCEAKTLQQPLLAGEKVTNNRETSRTFLDLPTLKQRSNSIDSGFRTASSCTASEIDSCDVSMYLSRFSSHRSSIATNVLAEQEETYLKEVKSMFSLDGRKTAASIQRGSLDSGNSENVVTSRTSFHSVSSSTRNVNDNGEPSTLEHTAGEEVDGDDDDDEGIVHIIPRKGWAKRVAYVILFPLIFLLFFTLPNVKNPRWRCFFPYVFVGSVLWIGVFSYFMVWWATEFGDTANIPPSVMGLTFLAAGTSIPDLITSVIVARKGFGDMALSSSIGSNMFDVTVGLPIPWLLFSATHSGQPISVLSNGLFCSVLLLVGMLLVMIISIAIFRWKLGKLLGIVYMVMYLVFVTLSILLELIIHCTIGG